MSRNTNTIGFYPREKVKDALIWYRNANLRPDFYLISVSDTQEALEEMVSLAKAVMPLERTLFLVFDDTDEENGERVFSDTQAREIVEFLRQNHNENFIIHCQAGISRSAAIAKFANFYLDRGERYLESYAIHNKRVYDRLMDAIGMSVSGYYSSLVTVADNSNSLIKDDEESEVSRLRKIISDLGGCPDCGQIMTHHLSEPFSSCKCGTGEDYGKRPIQKMQIQIYDLETKSRR